MSTVKKSVAITAFAWERMNSDHDGPARAGVGSRPASRKTDQTASIVIRGHAFIQNLQRGHYELGLETRHPLLRLAAAFDELALAI